MKQLTIALLACEQNSSSQGTNAKRKPGKQHLMAGFSVKFQAVLVTDAARAELKPLFLFD